MKSLPLHPHIRRALNYLVAGFLAWAVVGVFVNARQLASVSVTLLPGGIEHKDRTFMNVGKENEAADYQLKIRSQERWIDLGTYVDTPIGDGLTFTPSEHYPIRTLQEVMLLDQDKVESDVLDEGPLNNGIYRGNNYAFEVASAFGLEAGFHWFFATPVGKAILLGIGLAVFLIVFSNLN